MRETLEKILELVGGCQDTKASMDKTLTKIADLAGNAIAAPTPAPAPELEKQARNVAIFGSERGGWPCQVCGVGHAANTQCIEPVPSPIWEPAPPAEPAPSDELSKSEARGIAAGLIDYAEGRITSLDEIKSEMQDVVTVNSAAVTTPGIAPAPAPEKISEGGNLSSMAYFAAAKESAPSAPETLSAEARPETDTASLLLAEYQSLSPFAPRSQELRAEIIRLIELGKRFAAPADDAVAREICTHSELFLCSLCADKIPQSSTMSAETAEALAEGHIHEEGSK